MILEGKGILHFEPGLKTRKQIRQAEWKRTAVIEISGDIHLYYAWYLNKRFNLQLNRPIRGAHITIVADRVDNRELYNKVAEKYNGKEISFFYKPEEIFSNDKHWWLRVVSPEALEIRKEAGLSEKPYWGLHITLGYVNEKNLEHGKYIHDMIKFFNL